MCPSQRTVLLYGVKCWAKSTIESSLIGLKEPRVLLGLYSPAFNVLLNRLFLEFPIKYAVSCITIRLHGASPTDYSTRKQRSAKNCGCRLSNQRRVENRSRVAKLLHTILTGGSKMISGVSVGVFSDRHSVAESYDLPEFASLDGALFLAVPRWASVSHCQLWRGQSTGIT